MKRVHGAHPWNWKGPLSTDGKGESFAKFCHKNGHEAMIHNLVMKRGCFLRGVRHGSLCAWNKKEKGLGFSIRMTRDTEISATCNAKFLRFAVESGRRPSSSFFVSGKSGVCPLMHSLISPPTQRSVVLA